LLGALIGLAAIEAAAKGRVIPDVGIVRVQITGGLLEGLAACTPPQSGLEAGAIIRCIFFPILLSEGVVVLLLGVAKADPPGFSGGVQRFRSCLCQKFASACGFAASIGDYQYQ
jgi:hypothetical protein